MVREERSWEEFMRVLRAGMDSESPDNIVRMWMSKAEIRKVMEFAREGRKKYWEDRLKWDGYDVPVGMHKGEVVELWVKMRKSGK